MPLYRCLSPGTLLTDDTRHDIAQAITEIHSSVTGAPRSFVHVFFFNRDGSDECRILGGIRAGRDAEKQEELRSQITEAFSSIAGVSLDTVKVDLTDSPSHWTMEHGAVLPEPGNEEEWLIKHGLKQESE